MRKDLMKKLVLMLMLVATCGMLAACGDDADKAAEKGGNYYDEFICMRDDDDYKITGQAHVEDALPLVYLQAQAETTLNLELTFNSAQGDIRLDYVKPDGEVLPLCGNAVTDITTPTTMTVPLTLLAGESCLQWTATADAAATADFELTLTNIAGVEFINSLDEEMEEMEKEMDAMEKEMDKEFAKI